MSDRPQEGHRTARAADTPIPVGFALGEAWAEAWQTTVEELRTAEDELRQQNEALALAAERAEAERERYLELFHDAPDGYLVTDANGVVREANRAAAELLRVPARFLAGKPLAVFVAPESFREYESLLRRLAAGGAARGECLWVRRRDADPVPVGVHAAPAARGAGLRWLLRDLTELKRAEARALQAERLAALGEASAVLAHEGRAALQSARACLRMLVLEVPEGSEAGRLAGRLEHAHDRLGRLFDDLRSFAGPLELRRGPCDLAACWREAWAELAPARLGRDCELMEETPGYGTRCVGDAFRLGQVFRNLFDNALAACPDPVRVVVRASPARLGDAPAVAVTVADNGPGFPAEARRRAFEPFCTTKPHGTGLGLAVARRVVEAHGGRVALAPEADGAVVRVTLPKDDV